MGITTVKLVSQKLLIKHSLNWFKPVCAQLIHNKDKVGAEIDVIFVDFSFEITIIDRNQFSFCRVQCCKQLKFFGGGVPTLNTKIISISYIFVFRNVAKYKTNDTMKDFQGDQKVPTYLFTMKAYEKLLLAR